jgi:hypothetical protein
LERIENDDKFLGVLGCDLDGKVVHYNQCLSNMVGECSIPDFNRYYYYLYATTLTSDFYVTFGLSKTSRMGESSGVLLRSGSLQGLGQLRGGGQLGSRTTKSKKKKKKKKDRRSEFFLSFFN